MKPSSTSTGAADAQAKGVPNDRYTVQQLSPPQGTLSTDIASACSAGPHQAKPASTCMRTFSPRWCAFRPYSSSRSGVR